ELHRRLEDSLGREKVTPARPAAPVLEMRTSRVERDRSNAALVPA
ncbi:MAG: hypothetical protein JO090_03065, partial [Rhizobacter sp.]|nr:hypothetical protein [Rhizobacter sp.]